MQDRNEESAYAFGPFRLLLEKRQLLRGGHSLQIGSRAFDILRVLCENAGAVVTKETLIREVWGGVLVEDGNIRVHVSALRKVLGEGQADARYIANVPLKGYMLVASLEGSHASARSGAMAPVQRVRPAPGHSPGATPPDAVVHVVDDDPSIRFALDSLFRSVGMVCRTYGSADEFVRSNVPRGAGCLVLDVRLPGISGLEFQRQLLDGNRSLPTIFMTGHADIPMCVQGMKAGAVDFLTKPFRDQDMLDAVAKALAQDHSQREDQRGVDELRARFDQLTARERQVMALVTAGKMNKQAAGDLGLSEITVKIHRGRAMKKMGARSLADLVRMASALALPPLEPQPN